MAIAHAKDLQKSMISKFFKNLQKIPKTVDKAKIMAININTDIIRTTSLFSGNFTICGSLAENFSKMCLHWSKNYCGTQFFLF